MPTLRVPSAVAGFKGGSVTVRRWLKATGEAVARGQVLVELEGEEGLIQLEAAADGVLGAIVAGVGQTVALGAALAEFGGQKPEARSQKPEEKKAVAMSSAVTPVLMPQAGNSMEEGKIVKWLVKEGDRIKVGQVIMEVETDKATVEVEATDAGRVAKIVAKEGDVVPVKQAVAYLSEGEVAGEPEAEKQEAGSKKQEVAAAPGGAVVPVLMPQAGNSMEEGTILKWRVKEGDRVTVGQILYEVETDKATVEVEATAAGRIARIVAGEGAVVPVKQPVAYLAENDADVAGFVAAGGVVAAKPEARSQKPIEVAAANTPSGAPAPLGMAPGGRVKASPAARKLAKEKGIDLAAVVGSGAEGRIMTTDLANVRPAAKAAPVQAPRSTSVVRRPMSKMRKAIATNLQQSKQTVPHFYVKLTINADPLFAFYKAQKPATGCTLNDVVLLAVGRTVGDFGAFRSRIEGNDIVELPGANIGVAVSVPDGLVVPVVMNVDALSLAQVAAEGKRVAESARAGKIENMGKGVFTISNMGMLGVEEFSAIINPPESGILAIAAVREAVIVKDGAMKAGRVMTMTLSVDHRVVDGALAAEFMKKLKERLESPETMA